MKKQHAKFLAPLGVIDSSPAIHRWEKKRESSLSPVGTTEGARFSRPYGTGRSILFYPQR